MVESAFFNSNWSIYIYYYIITYKILMIGYFSGILKSVLYTNNNNKNENIIRYPKKNIEISYILLY